jgi:hypothetical protein
MQMHLDEVGPPAWDDAEQDFARACQRELGLTEAGLTDADLRAAARADLDRRRGDYRYVSPLPPEQRHPIELPDWLVSDGSAEAMGDLARLA